MRPQAAGVANRGTILGDSAAMGIDANSIEHIMSVLTNLYRNAKRAVAREYATNAWDAHVEAGITNKPIEVSLPSAYNPQFEVRDYGVGLSTDELLRVYSQYGASTKRETDEQTGMLGLGSKSALAYAKQFTVISRKNGVLTQALIFLNNRGAGEITIVDTRGTDEADGTTIRVPIEQGDINSFVEQALDVYAVFDEGTILVDGESPNRVWNHKQAIHTPDFTVTPYEYSYGRRSQGVFVIQGNVAYEIDDSEFNFRKFVPTNYNVWIRVPIGTLQFTPSREDIYYTDHSKSGLESVLTGFRRNLDAEISKRIANCKSKPEAFVALHQFRDLISSNSGLTWNGNEIPTSLDVPGFLASVAKGGEVSEVNMIGPSLFVDEPYSKAILGIVTEYTNTLIVSSRFGKVNMASAHRTRLRNRFGVSDTTYRYNSPRVYVATGPIPDDVLEWLPEISIETWSDLMKATRAPSAKTGTGSQGALEMLARDWEWSSDGKRHVAKLPAGVNGVYLFGVKEDLPSGQFTNSLLDIDAVVTVRHNQVDKFAREFPNAVTPKQARQMLADKIAKHKDDFDHLARQNFARTYTWGGTVDDPRISELFAFDNKRAANALTLRTAASQLRMSDGIAEQDYARRLNAYPLLSDLRGWRTKDTDKIAYVNAMYAYTQKGN